MATRASNDGSNWSKGELKLLKQLAASGIGAVATAKQLGRTAPAVQQKAMRIGIGFRRGARKKAAKKK
jgi:hypothetical protein